MNATHEKLKPCPCCGGSAELIKGYAAENVWPHGEFHRVFCGVCQLRQLFQRTPEEAIAAWNKRAQHAGEAEKPAEFEIRVGGIHMAGASGPRELALQEAQRYFRQYAFDATEDEPVQLVEVIEVASAPVAAMSATPPAGER